MHSQISHSLFSYGCMDALVLSIPGSAHSSTEIMSCVTWNVPIEHCDKQDTAACPRISSDIFP